MPRHWRPFRVLDLGTAWSERLAPRTGRFTQKEKVPITDPIRRLEGPKADVGEMVENKIPSTVCYSFGYFTMLCQPMSFKGKRRFPYVYRFLSMIQLLRPNGSYMYHLL
jgi:hypothetical protein